MTNDNKIKISSPLFAAYLIYIILIWGFELIDCLCYAIDTVQTTIASRVLIIGLLILGLWKIRKFVKCSETQISKSEFVAIIIILMIGILKSVYPDTAYDTYNYHLIAQRRGFINYFTEHFGKGNFQIWGFRLGDRLFFLFRYLLGYRIGTILNTFVLIVMYVQIYHILDLLRNGGEAEKKQHNNIFAKVYKNKAIWAFAIIMIHDAILMIGTYYVDILAIPVGLEVLRNLLENDECVVDKRNIYYFAFLNGIWFAFKMTNIVFVCPCVVMYIIKIRKHLTIKTVTISGVLALLPCSVYLIFNYVSTGNPIFPYFNTFFKSQYFSQTSFKDQNWGGANFFEKFFWIFYLIFKPEYRQSEIPSKCNVIFVIGIFGVVIVILKKIFFSKRNFTPIDNIVLILISSSILWSFSTGYSRYFLFGMILLGIIAYYIAQKSKENKVSSVLGIGFMAIIITQTVTSLCEFYAGKEWSWNKWTEETYVEQNSYVLKDREFSNTKDTDVDMFFITDSYYTGYAEMYNSRTYTFNASYQKWLDNIDIAEKELFKHKDLLQGNVYDIRKRELVDVDTYVELINSYDAYIENMQVYDSDIGLCVLIKLNCDRDKTNEIIFSDEENYIKCENLMKHGILNFTCGRIYAWETSPIYQVVVSKVKNDGKEEIFKKQVDNMMIEQYQVDLGKIEKDTCFEIEFYDLEGNKIDNQQVNKYFVLNPNFTSK